MLCGTVHCWEAHDNIWKAIKQRGYENDVPPLRRDMTAITVNISMALMSVIDLVCYRIDANNIVPIVNVLIC